MFPTTTLGLVLFVVLLAPGFLAGVARSRATPTTAQSALRETATVVFLSLVAWFFVGIVAVILRGVRPTWTPDVGALVRTPTQAWQAHHVSLSWWSIGLVAAACVTGYGLGRITATERAKFVGRWLTPGATSHYSGWYLTLAPDAEYFSSDTNGPTVIRCVLDDGTIVVGDVLSFNPSTPESGDRDLILTAPIWIQPANNDDFEEPIETGLMVISNRHIKYFTVEKFADPRQTPTS
jgi:hypothetical protein